MGFENWEVGFRKKMGWEMALVPRFRTLKNAEMNLKSTTTNGFNF